MAKKILKILTNNLGFKLLAVVFAFALWIVVYNIDDPTKTQRFTIGVTLENTDAVTGANKYYEILNNSNNITFSVSGKRSIIDNLDPSDFTATADMSNLVYSEDGSSGSVIIKVVSNRHENALSYNGRSQYLYVSLEDAMSKSFVVAAESEGEVAQGYALGNVSVDDTNILKVSGPASIVSRIATVAAKINVEGMSQNISDSVLPVLYDEQREEIDTTKLTLSNSTVTVSAMILSTKEVSLNFATTGTPDDNYAVVGITSSPSAIRVKGTSTILNPLTSIDIPKEVLDVTGARETLVTTIDVTEYLPSGVELVNGSDASISVTVEIEAYETREFTILNDQLSVNGLAEGNTLSFTKEKVVVNIGGMSSDLNRLKEDALRGVIDVTSLEAGTHTVTITLDLDEQVYTVGATWVEIVITSQIAPEDNTLPEDTPNTEGSTTGESQGETTVDDGTEDDESVPTGTDRVEPDVQQ